MPFFWELTSGGIPYLALIGLTVDTWYCQSTEAFVRISFFLRGFLGAALVSTTADCFAGVDALRAMFPSVFSSPDVLHRGRYGPEGLLCGSAVAVCQGRCHPCRYAEADSHGQACWRTVEISQLQYAPGGRCPCCAG